MSSQLPECLSFNYNFLFLHPLIDLPSALTVDFVSTSFSKLDIMLVCFGDFYHQSYHPTIYKIVNALLLKLEGYSAEITLRT
jgi:hypothetical protein